ASVKQTKANEIPRACMGRESRRPRARCLRPPGPCGAPGDPYRSAYPRRIRGSLGVRQNARRNAWGERNRNAMELNSLVVIAGGVAAFLLWVVWLGLRVIPNDRVGVVEKKFSGRGSVKHGFIALAGEAGFQPQVLRGGWHWLTPFQFSVHKLPLVTITQ